MLVQSLHLAPYFPTPLGMTSLYVGTFPPRALFIRPAVTALGLVPF